MTFNQFKEKWQNKVCDFDGFYGGQCVDLYRMYCQEVLDCPQSPKVKGAKNIWDTYLKDCFVRISNTPDGVPENGDIMIWGMGEYGHVAIFENGDTKTFNSFDQNFPVGSKCHTQSHNYKDVLGWLRYTKPVNQDTSTLPDMGELNNIVKFIQENNITEGQLREGFAYVKDQTVPKLEKKVKDLEKLQSDLEVRLTELEGKVSESEQNEANWQKDLSTANKTISNLNKDLEFYKPYKTRYEEKCKEAVGNQSPGVLFKTLMVKLGLWPKK